MPFKLTDFEANPCVTESEANPCFSVVIDDLEGKFYRIFYIVIFSYFFSGFIFMAWLDHMHIRIYLDIHM
jgi:hypothetical protein